MKSIKLKISLNAFGNNRFYIGSIIAVSVTVISYGFFFCLRQIFSLFTSHFSIATQITPLDSTSMMIGDFLLAMLACQVGQMIFFEFCFSKPSQKLFWNFRKRSILVDNRNLLFNFLFVGIKIALIIALYLAPDFYDLLEVNGIFFWILILSVIVIHFNAWLTIIRTFQNSIKWSFLSLGGMFLFSCFLIQIHPIDYQKINTIQLNRIPEYLLKVELPETPYPLENENYYDYRNLSFTLQQHDTIIVLMNRKDTISFDTLPAFIIQFKDQIYQPSRSRIGANLKIDKNVEMEQVFRLKTALRLTSTNKIIYQLFPKNYAYKQFYPYNSNYNNSLGEKLLPLCMETEMKESLELLEKTQNTAISELGISCFLLDFVWEDQIAFLKNKTTVTILENGKVLINRKPVEPSALVPTLKHIFNHNNSAIFFKIHPKSKYDDYIKIKVAIRKAELEYRDALAQKEFGQSYLYLHHQQKRKINRQYPIYFFEPNTVTEGKIYKELERIRG